MLNDTIRHCLSPRQLRALVLFYLRDFSIRRISEVLMVPENTSKSDLHRAKARLYKALKAQQIRPADFAA